MSELTDVLTELVAARRREAELAQLTARWPDLEWEAVDRDYDAMYRAYQPPAGAWLHIRFSSDGDRWASCPIAEEHIDDPLALKRVVDRLDALLDTPA